MTPQQQADQALEEILQTQWDGIPVVRLDSPPGAGKTGVAERLAVQSMALMNERCVLVTQTNEQAFDLARRLCSGFPRLTFTLLTKRGLELPADVAALVQANLVVVTEAGRLPEEPSVVIANSAKWSWVPGELTGAFDLMIVDEAFQLPDFRFHQIANLARRIVLIGDPGQIDPVITAEIERWRGNAAGPQVPAPEALVHRHPAEVLRLSLPVSRRLVPDTVELVQPAFYPQLPFAALAGPDDRRLTAASGDDSAVDQAIDKAASGASLVGLELPATTPGQDDPELAETIIALIERLLERGAEVTEGGEMTELEPSMIGVICAHVVQVHAVRERLPGPLQDVLVETADRFQGLERQVMLVHHPLSGRADGSEFHLDAGRLCVMLSRHRTACFVLTRGGIERQLLEHGLTGERVLSLDEDREYEGWKAHLTVVQQLENRGRIVSTEPDSSHRICVRPRGGGVHHAVQSAP